MSELLKKFVFFVYFWQFFFFLCPWANRSRHSLLICSFLMSDLSDSLPSLITKEGTLRIHSHPSLLKTDHERFAQVAHAWQKRSGGRFGLFHEWITLSLTKNERIAQKTDEQISNPAKKWSEGKFKSLKIWKWAEGKFQSLKVYYTPCGR